MATEAWFRNPEAYIKELIEVGVGRIAWDRGYTYKRKIDPVKHANLYVPATIGFRLLHIGAQGTAEYRQGDKITKPCAVYPTWSYGNDDSATLEEMLAMNVGDDEELCNDTRLAIDERPVLGQEHRVVVTDIPPAHTGPGRKFLKFLRDLQEEYPEPIVHVHGLYSFRMAFGMGFGAADIEVRTNASKGKVYLPNGKEVLYEQTVKSPQWVTLLGMSPVDLKVPRNRCIYNIKSAIWASENFEENVKFRASGKTHGDPSSSDAVPATTSRVHLGKASEGDKFLCDTCSLQTSCKYFRSGGVCSIPDSEPAALAKYFKTRDSELIIDGLGTLLATQTRRLERGLEDEDDMGELDPEVTKIINSLFGNGVKLAKLVNPALAGGPKVNVNVNTQGGAQVTMGDASPKKMVAAVVAELEARGIPRAKITPEMIEAVLDPDRARAAIDATVVSES